MSVNYSIYLIYGIEIKDKDYKVITSPAIYDNQNRYDSKTGKVTHTEKVLVKHEDYVYKIGKNEYSSEKYTWDCVLNDISKKLKLTAIHDYDTGTTVIGKKVMGQNRDFGRVDAPEGKISIESLHYIHTEVMETLIKHNILVDPSDLMLRTSIQIG